MRHFRFLHTLIGALALMLPASAVACSLVAITLVDEDGSIGPAPVPPPLSEAERVREALPDGFRGEAWVQASTRVQKAGYDDPCATPMWPWASITKQLVATLVMQQVDAGRIVLDAPAGSYVTLEAAGDVPMPTIRELLQHRSGLRNPEDSPRDATDIPNFYTDGEHGVSWCLSEREAPPATGWRYNNCDFIVLGAVLEAVVDAPVGRQIEAMLDPLGGIGPDFAMRKPRRIVGSKEQPLPLDISRYGASGAMVGPLRDVAMFNRALLQGELLSEAARAEMWRGDPDLGFMALGQWVFDARLDRCDEPVRIVERRGRILDYQLRNFILPDLDKSLVVGAIGSGFEFGELWQGSGVAHDLLSALACEDKA